MNALPEEMRRHTQAELGDSSVGVSKILLAVISTAFLVIPLDVLAQEPGTWMGEWQVAGRPSISGSMEMEVDVVGDRVTGRVKSRCTSDDPLEWAKLAGVRKNEKVFAQYDRGGRCGKVDVVYSIDPEGKVMTGTWSNQYPSSGTFRLTR